MSSKIFKELYVIFACSNGYNQFLERVKQSPNITISDLENFLEQNNFETLEDFYKVTNKTEEGRYE
jgi:hypothetical protein